MSPLIDFRPEADLDATEAFLWYLDQDETIAADFLAAVNDCVDRILEFPEAHAIVHREVRRALLRRFPYGLFYVLKADRIVVLACFHASRDPREWRERV